MDQLVPDASLDLGQAAPPISRLTVESTEIAPPEGLVARIHQWFSAISGTGISLLVHLLLLISLAFFHLAHQETSDNLFLNAGATNSVGELDDSESFDVAVLSPTDSSSDFDPGSAVSVDADVSSLTVDSLSDTNLQGESGDAAHQESLVGSLSMSELLTPLGISEAGGNGVIVQGAPIRGASSPREAVNGLGGDIVRHLQDSDVHVVWLFDASLSMVSDRLKASKQMGAVFREIDTRSENRSRKVRNTLMCFGQRMVMVQESTDKWQTLLRRVPDIPNDVSGRENVFSALRYAIPEFKKTSGDKLMFVVWTDESGDDIDQMEDVIALCRKEEVSVSVVGPTAVLGRRKGAQYFSLPKVHRYQGYLPVEKGPDAGVRQLIPLPHWYGSPLVAYGGLYPNVMPSGFGPYHLVRLSQATGGSYTVYDRSADRGKFKLDELMDYLPEYGPAATIRDKAMENKLRRAVIEASELTARVGVMRIPVFDPKHNPQFFNWLPARDYQPKFAAIINQDLQNVTLALPSINQAYEILTQEGIDEAFAQEESPRWRASYLLARGRIASLSVRYREYALIAQGIVGGRVLSPNTTVASLHPSSKLRTGKWGSERRKEALLYLRRCEQEHPRTPWAELARLERVVALGFAVKQRVTEPNYNAPGRPSGGGGGGGGGVPSI